MMEFRSQKLRDGRLSGSRNKDGKDDYSKSKDDHPRAKDDRSRSKDELLRGKDDHARGKDHSRSKDDYSRSKDDYSRSKDDFSRGKDDYSRGKDDYSRGKDDYSRGKDDYSRSKDDYSRGKPRRSEAERSSFRASGQQKLSEGTRDGSEGRRTTSSEAKPFSDDSKLSGIIRRIIRDDDRDKRLAAIGQLREFLLVSDNYNVILKTAENLLNVICDIFYERTSREIKQDMAVCLGILGYVLSTESDRFFLWLFPKVSTAHTIDEIKILLLAAVAETIKQDVTGENLNQFIPMIMAKCQSILENADIPELLIAIVDVIMLIAKAHPLSFSRHFKDTVDILVGWHIDTTQKDSLIEYTSQALISFQQFWTSELSFSFNLLGQFLEDMEEYVEELVVTVSDQASETDLSLVEESITKVSALLRVFTSVLKSIWNSALGDFQYFLEIFQRLVKCVNATLDHWFNEKMLIYANNCLLIILEKLHSGHATSEMESTFLLSFLVTQVLSKTETSNVHLVSLLNITTKVIDFVNVHLPTSFLSELLSPNSVVPHLCLSTDQKVLECTMKVYKSVLALRSVPLLEEGYRLVLSQLERAFNVLLNDLESDELCSLVSTNPFIKTEYSAAVAETIILFCVCALAELGNAKGNLIGMWLLSPNIFQLFSQRLMPLNSDMMINFPAVHFAILEALYSHSTRHNHFVVSSQLISQCCDLESSVIVITSASSATGGHFESILSLLGDLLRCHSVTFDNRTLVLKWSRELIEILNTLKPAYNTREFLQFIIGILVSAYNPMREITKIACNSLCAFLRNSDDCPVHILHRIKELCCIRLCDMDNEVQQVYFELLRLLPLNVTTRVTCSLVEHDMNGLLVGLEDGLVHAYRQACSRHAAHPASGNFHSHNFTRIMAFILQDVSSSQKGGLSTWLERQFYSCLRWEKETTGKEDGDLLGSVIDRNERLLWFWATWEAAQFCIQSKLRTPLGKPQETFTAIGAAIKKYHDELRNHDDSDGVPKTSSDSSEQRSVLHARLLLQFLENLEKHLYNASEGCAVAMATPPKAVRTFFRTNRGTCQEWLTRIRLSIMQVAGHCHEPGMVVRHAFELLHGYKDGHFQSGEFDKILLLAVEALCKLRSPEAIQGLWVWAREVSNRKLNWIRAAADMASGKFESAIANYRTCLRGYMAMDSLFEDIRETKSPSPSPFSSPAHSLSRNGTPHRVTLLSKPQDISPNSQHEANVVNFMVHQISEAYIKLECWEDAVKWHSNVRQYSSEHTGSPLQKAFSTGTDESYLRALQSFGSLEFEKVEEHLEQVPFGSISGTSLEKIEVETTWDIKDIIKTTERLFIQAATLLHVKDPQTEMDNVTGLLSKSQLLCENILRSTALPWPTHLDSDALMQMFHSTLLLDQLDSSKKPESWLWPLGKDLWLDPLEHDVSDSLRALQQIKLQASLQPRLYPDRLVDFSDQLSKLRLATVGLARRHCNFQLGTRLLLEQVTQMGLCESCDSGASNDEGLLNALAKLHTFTASSTDELHLRIKMEREGAKLLYCRNLAHDAIETLSTSIVNTFAAMNTPTGSNLSKSALATAVELNARSLVTLVKWLQSDTKYAALIASQLHQVKQDEEADVLMIVRKLKILTDLETTMIGGAKPAGYVDGRFTDHPDSDSLIEKLLCLGTAQCPKLAKAWFSLAGWCYKWGRKAVDTAVHGSIELSTDEKARIVDLLPPGISLEETDAVLSILSQTHTGGASSEEDISENEQARYDDGSETVKRQLTASCPSILAAGPRSLDQLVSVWRSIVDQVYCYYKLSAKAYFTFLGLNGQSEVGSEVNMDGNITATLRLLRLLVKHAWELQDTLEDGLAHSPTAPWKGIIPQLFSRLNHPEPYVRQSVSDLLCRVGSDAPHLIVYPAVVGYSSGKDLNKEESDRDGLLNEYLSQSETEGDQLDVEPEEAASQEEDVQNEDRTVIQNCFAAILESLSSANPKMTNEVQVLVSELRRITLLWDELWLGTLTQIHQDVVRRLKQLENEVRKVQENVNLSAEEAKAIILKKHHTILKPTLHTLEMLHDVTSQLPETPHEKWFQESYGKQIETALEALRKPTNPKNPNISWQPLKQLHHSLQQRIQKRPGQVLNMSEISPRLTALKHTAIAMPGLSSSGQIVTIDSICNAVFILPTKTKPKKLVFVGSNGLRYTYLFKGLEDLHLDERIMQFVSTVNNMLVQGNSVHGQLYRARHYSVTPLGARSGLIQWVDGATPMFSLYKRWQQREATLQQMKQQASTTSSTTAPVLPTPIPRPSELFYSKLNPLLRDKGVSQENRKEWPIAILRKVLDELISETPKDLLSKELWCSSATSAEWWLVTKTYARSTAVMSMIGYIIGLGDRHLDNVLVDLSTGEVVHIDYNVCFEKGKSLRVPEKVPFRMTQNLQHALGPTGIEGTFRIACEHVLKTMRRGRETLLTLLEAFLYDPLVDWTIGNEWGYTGAFYGGNYNLMKSAPGRQSKRDMEREITVNMFSIRVAEIKTVWLNNREDFMAAVSKLEDMIQKQLDMYTELNSVDLSKEKLQNQSLYLENASADRNGHPIETIVKRYREFAVAKSRKQDVLRLVSEKLNECEIQNSLHEYSLDALRGNRLQQMGQELSRSTNSDLSASLAAVVEFLQGAGQANLVCQYDQSCQELQQIISQHHLLLRNCLDVLHKYSQIIGHFPRSLEKTNRCSRWKQWLRDLICDFTIERVQTIEDSMLLLYSGNPDPRAAKIVESEHQLQIIVSEANVRLHRLMEMRQNLTDESLDAVLSHVHQFTSVVHFFMQERGICSTMCMASVLILDLCSAAKSMLDMEKSFSATGGRFGDLQLKSIDGTWLLDHFIYKTSDCILLLELLNYPLITELMKGEDARLIECAVASTKRLYTSFQELYLNFHNVIIPEALAAFEANEPTVLSMFGDLDSLLNTLGMPVDLAIEQLEQCLTQAKLQPHLLEVNQSPMVTTVKKLRGRFEKLCLPLEADHSSDRGQLLLVVFAGLFARVESDFKAFVNAVTSLQLPEIWKMVDLVIEAHSIQNIVLTEAVVELLASVFFLKQLKLMTQFFQNCQTASLVMLGTSALDFFDNEKLSMPFKVFICELLYNQVTGLPSQVLSCGICFYLSALGLDVAAEIERKELGGEDSQNPVSLERLCTKGVDLNLKNDVFSPEDFQLAESTLVNAQKAWKHVDIIRHLDNGIEMERACCQHTELQLVCYQWLHEDILFNTQVRQPMPGPRRSLMSELKKAIQTLVQYGRENLNPTHNHQQQLEKTVAQRLKWAAGANPTLSQTLQQFEDSVADTSAALDGELRMAADLAKISKGILHYEAMLTRTQDALSSDATYSQLLNKCKESCLLNKSSQSLVTNIEADLVEIKMPTEPVSTEWIKSVMDILDGKISEVQQKQNDLLKDIDSGKETVKSDANNIRMVLVPHHKLMSDMKIILKSLAKLEDHCNKPGELSVSGIGDYMLLYRSFSENLSTLLTSIGSEELSEDSLRDIICMIHSVKDQITRVYNGLVSMAPPLVTSCDGDTDELTELSSTKVLGRNGDIHFPQMPKKSATSSGSHKVESSMTDSLVLGAIGRGGVQHAVKAVGSVTSYKDKVTRDPITGKALQERNSYAVGVWRKIKQKLDGRELDVNKRLTIPEQVDSVIKEAINPDNLAVLFEGWTPWV